MRAPRSIVPRHLVAAAAVALLAFTGPAAYQVREGDTLTSIARRFGVAVDSLVRANAIKDPDRIVAGRSLTVPTPVVAATGVNALGISPRRLALVPHFRRWSAANGIPADLLMATAWLESGWQNSVVSPAGARGIGQLMPATVVFVREELIGVPGLDPAVPAHNIRMSARYLGWLLRWSGGDVGRALAGYYQGPRSVLERGPLPTTQAYVRGVLSLRARFRT